MAVLMELETPEGVVEIVPSYRSIIIFYDPLSTDPSRLREDLLSIERRLSEIEIPPPRVVEIPVCYGGEFGPDIDTVAGHHELTLEEVIRLHSEPLYPVYMLAFTPGYPFLGGLPEKLHTPRLETPRTFVPAGSVGIANAQTGIYSIDSPGGWQIIGRTPLRLFDPERPEPFLLKAGDLVKFRPVSTGEFYRPAKGGGG